jgi:hypothetical protein
MSFFTQMGEFSPNLATLMRMRMLIADCGKCSVFSAGPILAKPCSCDSDYFGPLGKESDSIPNQVRFRIKSDTR